ncbi:MAG: serine/threonine-protein kinase [Vicinamibacterales bacterium]
MSGPRLTGVEPIGTIAHYNLLEALERSGPGELFRARDTVRGRTVIIRRLPLGFATREERSRIEEAARALSAISHPNVIRLFEVGDDQGRLFFVFEHLKGQSLRNELGGHVLRVRRAVQLAVQIADAVADAHAAGYVHAGLSPESVVITARGHAKIPAHELACRYGFDSGATPPRLRDYPSPEEAAGQAADERSDVFSVGAMLYEMLTARRPGVRGAALPSAANSHVPKVLDDVTLRAVAPNPERRHPTAPALVRDLRGVAALLDKQGSGDDEELPHGSHMPKGTAIGVAVLVVAALAGLAWWFMRG